MSDWGSDVCSPDLFHLDAQADTPYWLETLLAGGASPDTPNTVTHATPLMAALKTERGANAQRLLDAGAQVDAIDRQHNTALHVAAKINQMDWVIKQIDAGASPGPVTSQGMSFPRHLFMTPPDTTQIVKRKRQ